MLIFYSRKTLVGMISKAYKIQGSDIIKAITNGKSIVQQNDISWSYRILGKEALTHMNMNIMTQVLNPKVRPYVIPSIKGSLNKVTYLPLKISTYK